MNVSFCFLSVLLFLVVFRYTLPSLISYKGWGITSYERLFHVSLLLWND